MVKAPSPPDCARGDTLYCTAYGADSAAAADYMISFADEGTAKIGFVVIGPFLRWRLRHPPARPVGRFGEKSMYPLLACVGVFDGDCCWVSFGDTKSNSMRMADASGGPKIR